MTTLDGVECPQCESNYTVDAGAGEVLCAACGLAFVPEVTA